MSTSEVNDEVDTSSEERIQWLRDRGVLIEFPEERLSLSKSSNTTDAMVDVDYITVVKIPCNITEPYAEVKVAIPKQRGDKDYLLTSLKPCFTPVTQGIDELSLKEAASKTLSLSGQDIPEVSLSSLSKVGGDIEGSVEAFPLSYAMESNNFFSVNLYLDEVGQLKRLPRNERAIQLAATCNFNDVPLVGDMYVGRLKKRKGIEHIDFKLKEMNSDAEWLKDIKHENYEYGLKTNRVTMSSDTDPEVVVHSNEEKGYSWSETVDNVEIKVKLTEGLTYKAIKVDFHGKQVVVKRKTGDSTPLLSINLFKSIDTADSTWTGDKDGIEITLEKSPGGLWKKLEA